MRPAVTPSAPPESLDAAGVEAAARAAFDAFWADENGDAANEDHWASYMRDALAAYFDNAAATTSALSDEGGAQLRAAGHHLMMETQMLCDIAAADYGMTPTSALAAVVRFRAALDSAHSGPAEGGTE